MWAVPGTQEVPSLCLVNKMKRLNLWSRPQITCLEPARSRHLGSRSWAVSLSGHGLSLVIEHPDSVSGPHRMMTLVPMVTTHRFNRTVHIKCLRHSRCSTNNGRGHSTAHACSLPTVPPAARTGSPSPAGCTSTVRFNSFCSERIFQPFYIFVLPLWPPQGGFSLSLRNV